MCARTITHRRSSLPAASMRPYFSLSRQGIPSTYSEDSTRNLCPFPSSHSFFLVRRSNVLPPLPTMLLLPPDLHFIPSYLLVPNASRVDRGKDLRWKKNHWRECQGRELFGISHFILRMYVHTSSWHRETRIFFLSPFFRASARLFRPRPLPPFFAFRKKETHTGAAARCR